jgi:AcrR family transcriptional regulator
MTAQIPEPATRPGLRERKKRRTRELIARAALELFDRQGFAATTIAQVAEAADVAPRTVSVYFPAKEELAFPDRAEQFAALAERMRRRPAEETAPEALRAWIAAQAPRMLEREGEHAIQHRVVAADEHLLAYKRRFFGEVQELMAEEIARDLGASAQDPEPNMAAAATVSMLALLDERHGAPADGDLAEWHDEAMHLIDRATVFVSAGIRALRARR